MDLPSIIMGIILNALANNVIIPKIKYLLKIILKKKKGSNTNNNSNSVNHHPNTPFTFNGTQFVAHS